MNIFQKFNEKSKLSGFTGNDSSKRKKNSHNVALSRIKETNIEKIEPFLEEWSEGFEILFPNNKLFSDILKNKISKLINKINEIPLEDLNEVSKENNLKIDKIKLENNILNLIFFEFTLTLKGQINKMDNYFEPVEKNKLNDLLSIDHVFKYIKEMENNTCLDNILGKSPSQISKWRNNKKKLTINSVIDIKNNMLGKNSNLGLKIIEEKKANTYCFLIYCAIIIENLLEEKKHIKIENVELWIALLHTYREPIERFCDKIFKK